MVVYVIGGKWSDAMKIEEIRDRQRFADYGGGLTREMLETAKDNALAIIRDAMPVFVDKFPDDASVNGYYPAVENNDGLARWTTGFWTGMLWLAYEMSGDEEFRRIAEGQIPSFAEKIEKKIGVDHHDMGFLYVPSCVAAYKLTGNETAKKAALAAAEHLMTRWREKGGFIQAWGSMDNDAERRLIIDCMINIPLLYWANEVTGDKRFYEVAYKHFKTTVKHIYREDGSTYHTYFFDGKTGEALKGVTRQGWADDSCWARGQAWGIYGVPLTAQYADVGFTSETYDAAVNFWANRLPKDFVPFWDLVFNDGDDMPRDSSAAAIAVCGLLEMCKHTENEEKICLYRDIADSMMRALIEKYAYRHGDKTNGLLAHAVYSYHDNMGVDECNIWGDYYYMEALARYLTEWKVYW